MCTRVDLRMEFDHLRGGKERPYEDLMSFEGFMLAILLVLRGVPGFLLWAGLPCNSFGWMSYSAHRRCIEAPLGDTSHEFVATGNCLAARLGILAALTLARQGFWALENPMQSKVVLFPYYGIISKYLPHFRTRWSLDCDSILVSSIYIYARTGNVIMFA